MILPLASGEFPSLAPSDRSAIWAVTGRLGGSSQGSFAGANLADHVGDRPEDAEFNRQSLAALVGLDRGDLAIMSPVHGGQVSVVDSPGPVDSSDSLVTTHVGIGLVAMGADCVTLGISGFRGNGELMIAAVHCGWKGLCADVVGNTLAVMSDWGAITFQAVFGPSICGHCYVVSQSRIQEVRDSCKRDIADAALGISGGIDVQAGLQAQLSGLGIGFTSCGGCTAESPDELFSYWRDGRTGRQGLVIAIREPTLKETNLKDSHDA
jgi:polyphenol oxidase